MHDTSSITPNNASTTFQNAVFFRLVKTIATLYNKALHLVEYGADLFLLVMRLYWGWQCFNTGQGKLMNLQGTTEFFASLNIPMPMLNAIMAGGIEMIGGILLVVGLGTRFAGGALTIVMVVAYCTADYEKLSMIMTDPDGFTSAAPFLFLLTSLMALVFGAGRVSLDALLHHLLRRWGIIE